MAETQCPTFLESTICVELDALSHIILYLICLDTFANSFIVWFRNKFSCVQFQNKSFYFWVDITYDFLIWFNKSHFWKYLTNCILANFIYSSWNDLLYYCICKIQTELHNSIFTLLADKSRKKLGHEKCRGLFVKFYSKQIIYELIRLIWMSSWIETSFS